MRKKYIHFLPIFAIFSAVVIDFIIFYALMDTLEVWEKEITAALIGFVGSIMGGLLTLVGVRYTISYETKRERRERLPTLINDSWKIKKKFMFVWALDTSINDNPKLNDVRLVEKFYDENEEWITELSAKISPEMYNLCNKFFTLLSDYPSHKMRNELDIWFEKANGYINKLEIMVDSLEKEYNRIDRYY